MTIENWDISFVLINTYTSEKPDSPQTGDTSNIMLYVMLMIISGSVLIILGVTGKRNEHEETK